MAKAKVVNHEDGVTIIFKGDKANPEPSMGSIKFPGGLVEVSRTQNGDYWAHISVYDKTNIIDSRIDYDRETWLTEGIPSIPYADKIEHIAVRIKSNIIEETGE